MALEKTWQYLSNYLSDNTSSTTNWQNLVWSIKAFLCGQLGQANYLDNTATSATTIQGLWTVYYSCDGTTAGTAGDLIDRWGTSGSNTANSGSAASIVTGATITGAVKLTGLSGLAAGSVGKLMQITGAASSANNSPTSTPFTIVKYLSSSSCEVWNPSAVAGDASNGSISWQEKGVAAYTAANLVGAAEASAHSWIVLKSPSTMLGAPYYLTINMDSATVGQVSIIVAKNAFTGGTASTRPTSTNEIQTSVWQNRSIYTSGQGKVNGAITTTGDFHMLFHDATNGIRNLLILQVLAEPDPEDPYPLWISFGAGTNGPTAANLQTASVCQMITSRGLFNAANNTSTAGGALCLQWNLGGGGTTQVFDTMTTTDVVDSNYDDLPIYIFNSVGTTPYGNAGIRGRLYDYRWGPTGLTNGDVEPAAGTPITCYVKGIWMPACAAFAF